MNYPTDNEADFNLGPNTAKLLPPDHLFAKKHRINQLKDKRRATLDEVNLEQHAIKDFNGDGQCSPKRRPRKAQQTVTIQVSFGTIRLKYFKICKLKP